MTSMSKEKWEEAKKTWNNVKAHAEIDLSQAELYLEAIDKHLNSLSGSSGNTPKEDNN